MTEEKPVWRKVMKSAFWICLVIWLVGHLVGYTTGVLWIRETSVNIFGSITILLGLIRLGGWAWRKMAGLTFIGALPQRTAPIRSSGIDAKAVEICKKALAADLFKLMAKNSEGTEIIHVQSAHQDYLAVVEVVQGFTILKAAYPTSPSKVDADLSALLEAKAIRLSSTIVP